MKEARRQLIIEAIRRAGSQKAAAPLLGVSQTAVNRAVKTFKEKQIEEPELTEKDLHTEVFTLTACEFLVEADRKLTRKPSRKINGINWQAFLKLCRKRVRLEEDGL